MKKISMLLTNAFMPDPRPYREALSLIRAGYEISIICWDRGENLAKEETIDGIEVKRLFVRSADDNVMRRVFALSIIWVRMLSCLFKEKPDIVWCHDFDTLPVGLMFRVLKRNRVMFDSHEVYSKMLYGNIPGWLKRFVGFLERALIKKADGVIVTCSAMEGLYSSLGAGKITVVGNYKDPALFRIPGDVLERERKALGIKNELVICYIAKLGRERIIGPLLEIVGEDEGIFLILGGDGYQRPLAEIAARDCPRVKYLGYVAANRVPLYTALADLVYYGYDKNSGMAEYCNPNKLFEALAAGKAFIGGDFGQMGKIVKEEGCGVALEEFDKESIKKAVERMKDRGALRAFQENARRAGLEKYDWSRAEERLLEAVSRIMGKHQ